MKEYWKTDDFCVIKEKITPIKVKAEKYIQDTQELLIEKEASISFSNDHCAEFTQKGAFVVLDFGKELCGGVRIIIRQVQGTARFRITFGESVTEACSTVGETTATNDHSPRDFEVIAPFMSDLTFGQTGFRFVRIELLSEEPVLIRNIFAVNTLPYFEKEAVIKTSDEELNKIIETAAYTIKLNLQNGYIWDGIKRDRLVWCGDLHQEVLSALYLFGDNKNVPNSLTFLRNETPATEWVNTFAPYSAWWIVNLCDYCKLTGNKEYFEENYDYAEAVLDHFNSLIDEDGTMHLGTEQNAAAYFLDWPTVGTFEARIGVASILIFTAKKYLALKENDTCHEIIRKLNKYLEMPCTFKQARALQILAGRNADGEDAFLEKDGAAGFSTFMTYYILSADAMAGGKNMLPLIKEYFGGMLSRGATTFWEDFDLNWLEGSGRIDEFPEEGQKDIHGDYGNHCYLGFRHSLCHGWSSGVLAFIIEYVFGLQMKPGGEVYEVNPHTLGIKELYAKIPVKNGWQEITISDNVVKSEIKGEC